MKNIIKKMSALLVLAVFAMSMIPAAFAAYHMDIATSEENKEQSKTKEVMKETGLKIKKILQDEVRAARGTKSIRMRETREGIEDLRSKHDIRDYIRSLIKEPAFNSERAMIVVEYAIRVTEHLIEKLDAIASRIEGSRDFLTNHPDALKRITSIIGELRGIHSALEDVAADGTVSRDEWTEIIVPTLKELRSIMKDLGEKHRGLFNAWGQYHKRSIQEKVLERLEESERRLAQLTPSRRAKIEEKHREIRSRLQIVQRSLPESTEAGLSEV